MNTKKFALSIDKAVWQRQTYLVDVPEFVAVKPETLKFFMWALQEELERSPEASSQLLAVTRIVEMENDDFEYGEEHKPDGQMTWEEVKS
jgi:hypothetical protein